VVQGHSHDYIDRHIAAADCMLVIEVAQPSQDYERQVKARLYVACGAVAYWLVAPLANAVTVFRDPVDERHR
jgi:Uma2 family endonuclease